ncbi:hypothetical protein JHK85_001616 [Glycine max]|nr:hypothetical protein JHK85_001616 [Glycine max]
MCVAVNSLLKTSWWLKESNTKTKHGVERSRRSKEFPFIVDDGFVGGEGVDGRGCYKGVILPMVMNDIKKARREEHHQHGRLEESTNSLPWVQPNHPLVIGPATGVKAFRPPLIQ